MGQLGRRNSGQYVVQSDTAVRHYDRDLITGRSEIWLASTSAAFLFLPMFRLLPKLIQRAMKPDADAVMEAIGKNEQVKKVFWTLFISMAVLVLAQIADPATAEMIIRILTTTGL
jgi:hypothetical protein